MLIKRIYQADPLRCRSGQAVLGGEDDLDCYMVLFIEQRNGVTAFAVHAGVIHPQADALCLQPPSSSKGWIAQKSHGVFVAVFNASRQEFVSLVPSCESSRRRSMRYARIM